MERAFEAAGEGREHRVDRGADGNALERHGPGWFARVDAGPVRPAPVDKHTMVERADVARVKLAGRGKEEHHQARLVRRAFLQQHPRERRHAANDAGFRQLALHQLVVVDGDGLLVDREHGARQRDAGEERAERLGRIFVTRRTAAEDRRARFR